MPSMTPSLIFEVYNRGGGEEVVVTSSASVERTHSGVHVVVLHESAEYVMMARHFLTYQPAEHARLKQCLEAVHEGRLVIILGMVGSSFSNGFGNNSSSCCSSSSRSSS